MKQNMYNKQTKQNKQPVIKNDSDFFTAIMVTLRKDQICH